MRALTTVALLAAMVPAVRAAALQLFATQDIDDFHGVFCTENWLFLDAAGQRHPWSDMRGQAAKLLISKISLTRDGAQHTLTLSTRYKDTWTQVGDGWKQQSREQLGRPSQRVDEPAG